MLKKDPNSENYPYTTCIETLVDPFLRSPKRDPSSANYRTYIPGVPQVWHLSLGGAEHLPLGPARRVPSRSPPPLALRTPRGPRYCFLGDPFPNVMPNIEALHSTL